MTYQPAVPVAATSFTTMNIDQTTPSARRTWSDAAKYANRRRRLLRRLTRRAPLLAQIEYERVVAGRPDYFGEGTALPPPVRRRTARKTYRTRHEIKAEKRQQLFAQIDAFRRERGWDAVFQRLDFLRRRAAQEWADAYPDQAALAFPLFDDIHNRPDAG